MGCCEDYLTCDIAFNAVMPLSRASTRRRYSRVEGVTVPNSKPSNNHPVLYARIAHVSTRAVVSVKTVGSRVGGPRTVRLGRMVRGGKEHDVLPRFGPS